MMPNTTIEKLVRQSRVRSVPVETLRPFPLLICTIISFKMILIALFAKNHIKNPFNQASLMLFLILLVTFLGRLSSIN